MLQPSSGRSDPEMKTILLWTQWWTGMVAGQGSEGWMIPTLGFSWEDNAHVGLGDFGCDHESYKCTVTSNRCSFDLLFFIYLQHGGKDASVSE